MNNGFEQYLGSLIPVENNVDEAMNYALMAGGKRIRPQLLLCLLKDYGLDEKTGYPCAAAIEMIHTYSLIHDDLPTMDNDEFRRGKPTVHIAYGEDIAILAGDGLLTKAFESVCTGDYKDIKRLVTLLAQYSGHEGMIKGQQIDLSYTGLKEVTVDMLKEMDEYKTGKLITLPLLCADAIADKSEYDGLFEEVGIKLGLAFQIQDDILDYTSTAEQLGKSTSDSANEKNTYYTLLGHEKACECVETLFREIDELLSNKEYSFDNTKKLIETIRNRDK